MGEGKGRVSVCVLKSGGRTPSAPAPPFPALTGRDTPHARPRAALDGTNTYGTFCVWGGRVLVRVFFDAPSRPFRPSPPLLLLSHLVLREDGQVQQNLERLRVGRHDDKLGDAAVERFGGWGKKGRGRHVGLAKKKRRRLPRRAFSLALPPPWHASSRLCVRRQREKGGPAHPARSSPLPAAAFF